MLPPFNLPNGIFLLITDELPSPADFLLHRSLAGHIKESKDSKAIVLSVSEEIARWKAIAAKSNLNLSQHLESGSLNFLDVLSLVQVPPSDPNAPSLRPILEAIKSALDKSKRHSSLVILDDITTLQWIGVSLLDLHRFSRALHSICFKANATLIVRHHVVTPNELDDLYRHLLQLCTYHIDVRPLSSGRSGSVSGAVALHAGPSTCENDVKLIPRSSAVQYRLTDNGVIFFERGTGGGVL